MEVCILTRGKKKLTLNCLHFHNFEKQQSNSYNQNINKLHGHNPPRVITHTLFSININQIGAHITSEPVPER